MTVQEKLAFIQKELKAPKGQRNTFGNYNYRSCEDIVEAVKPLLETAILTLSDEIVMLGNRFYLKATAKLTVEAESIEVHGFARESEDKKGMDSAQITGAASSYARKYALNGLFAIDDTKDADTMENTANEPVQKPVVKTNATQMQIDRINDLLEQKGRSLDAALKHYKISNLSELTQVNAYTFIKSLEEKPDASIN